MWKLAEQPSDTDIPLGTLLDRTTLLKLSPLNGAVPPRKIRHVVPVLMVIRPPPRQGSQKAARFAKGRGPRILGSLGYCNGGETQDGRPLASQDRRCSPQNGDVLCECSIVAVPFSAWHHSCQPGQNGCIACRSGCTRWQRLQRPLA